MSDWDVVEYIRIARKEMHKPDDWLPTQADLGHSALLKRIRAGKPLYKIPPPRHYSYPWYDLIDAGRTYYVENVVLQKNDEGDMMSPLSSLEFYLHSDGRVNLCQDSRWRITDGGFTYTGKDLWVMEEVDPEDEIPSGVTSIYEGPVFANRVFKRVDNEDVW